MKHRRLIIAFAVLLCALCALCGERLFAARTLDSADLANVRRKVFNYRVEAEYDDNGTLLYVRCHRVKQTRSGGTVLNRDYSLPPVDLSAAELDAAGPQFRNRLEGLDAIADAKEAQTP